MPEPALSYTAAMTELQAIVRRMQEAEIGIDELPAQVQRAGELIQFCQTKLRSTEAELDKLLQDEPI